MTPLRVKGVALELSETVVGRVTLGAPAAGEILLLRPDAAPVALQEGSFALVDRAASAEAASYVVEAGASAVLDLPFTSHLEEGDIVALHPRGMVETLFRIRSPHNALFITDQCNSNCLMCSQPPKEVDDLGPLFDINSRLIPLIPQDTDVLGVTGGEPTLLGHRLATLFSLVAHHLPQTDLHVLTNGRSLADAAYARLLAESAPGRVVYGVPLYADHRALHDYVVQAPGAFYETVAGLHNLARFGQRVEIRVVLHRQTVPRLPQLAEFIYRNFPFVEHVALMGLEYTGYTPHNDELLWVEPREYAGALEESALYLSAMGMQVSVYNHPLCLLPRSLWPFAQKSISDWKQSYLDACTHCDVLDACGGVFATSKKLSREIAPVAL